MMSVWCPVSTVSRQWSSGQYPSTSTTVNMIHSTQDSTDPPISKTMQYKKITKPLLERKRRARINACLDELKEIMTGCLQTEGENVSKLEKADILELTVRHIQKLNQAGASNPVEEISKFRAGYSSCASEAAHFLLSVPGVDVRLGQRLVTHLMTGLQQPPPQPLATIMQQRMLSNLFTNTSAAAAAAVGNEAFARASVISPPPPPPFPLLFPASSSSSAREVPVTPSPPASQHSADLCKPLPLKPSPVRIDTSASNVWKPYSCD